MSSTIPPTPLTLLECYYKVQELLNLNGPSHPTNLLEVAVDNHTNPDPNGRVFIRFSTQETAQQEAKIATLEDSAPSIQAVPEPVRMVPPVTAPSAPTTVAPAIPAKAKIPAPKAPMSTPVPEGQRKW